MNPLSILLIMIGAGIELVGVLYCILSAGDAGLNMPLLIGAIVVGSIFTFGGVLWHVLLRRF